MSRAYEASHPWLRFEADLSAAPPALWMLLGEARSKCEHIRGVPLRPDTAEALHMLYLAKGVQATTAIEGNTLTESEVKARIEGTLELPPSKEYLGREVDNVVSACREIFARLRTDSTARSITPEMICGYNARVLGGLELEDAVEPGKVRAHNVVVGRYRGAPPQDCGYLLDRLCEWLNSEQFRTPEHGVAIDILRAVLAHLYLAWIHPFGDGNGRTARLVEFHMLVAAGVPAPAAHLLSNHYNQTRSEYYRQLDRASRSGGDIVAFVRYAVQGFVDQLQQQLAFIRRQQWDVAWRNYVHECYADAGPTGVRQRHLVLDLSATPNGDWWPIRSLPELTPRLAKAYARKTPRTLQRDVEALARMQLVEVESGRVRARPEVILAFLPAAVGSEPAEVATQAERKPTR
jgi:Fic family protein